MERLGINAAFNVGAMEWHGGVVLMARVEGVDRKSFFAVAESANGIDGFRFWDYPVVMPETAEPETNVYDMRLTAHEDGWIYGLFCAERKDPAAPPGDLSSARGAVRHRAHARFEDLGAAGRPADFFGAAAELRAAPRVRRRQVRVLHAPAGQLHRSGARRRHRLGAGVEHGARRDRGGDHPRPAANITPSRKSRTAWVRRPIKTEKGWLHLAHGVRNTAAGLRYVLYCFLCDLQVPYQVIAKPGGYFLAPEGEERVGDVSNVAFSNGWVQRGDQVLIYYGASDTRTYVAETTVERLLDYVLNTPPDPLRSAACVHQRIALIEQNLRLPGGARQ